MAAEADDCTDYEYAVILKTDNSLIGAATLMHLPDDPEIGWTLHRDNWRQGYGTEIGNTIYDKQLGTFNKQIATDSKRPY